MNLLIDINKHSFNKEDNKMNYKKKNNNYKKNYNNEYDRKGPKPKGGKFYKTHTDGFKPRNNQNPKDRNYEYENHKERGHDAKFQNSAHKNHFKSMNKNYERPRNNEGERGERGMEESKNKPGHTDQRRRENKAIFAHQLKSIHKTLTEGQGKPFTKPLPPEVQTKGYSKAMPPSNEEYKQGPKIEPKSTALAGRGIMNTNQNDRKYSGVGDKRKEKFPKNKFPTEEGHYGRDKRQNLGFKASAAAMFSGQTGGKGNFTDYT